jgi:hypothetical protein
VGTKLTKDQDLARGIEEIQEQVLELVSQWPAVQELVMEEFRQRFNRQQRDAMDEETTDEVICMCQLLVYRRILQEIA